MSVFEYTAGSRKFTRTRNSLKKYSFALTSPTSVGTSFDTGKNGSVEIKPANEAVYVKPEMLIVQCSSLAGGTPPTSVVVRITKDSNGDECIVPDTSGSLSTGLTTATDATAVYEIGLPYLDTASSAASLYLFFKTDSGTLTVDSADLYTTAETF
jgi:hypothetical protein